MFKLSNPFKARAIEPHTVVRKYGDYHGAQRDLLAVVHHDEEGGRTVMIVAKEGWTFLGYSPRPGIALSKEYHKAGSADSYSIIREVQATLCALNMPVTNKIQIEPLLK